MKNPLSLFHRKATASALKVSGMPQHRNFPVSVYNICGDDCVFVAAPDKATDAQLIECRVKLKEILPPACRIVVLRSSW